MWNPKLTAVAELLLISTMVAQASQDPANNIVANPETAKSDTQTHPAKYVLGADDVITVQALDLEEITSKPVRIDTGGYINLPLIGRLRAAGLTLEQLEAEMVGKLKTYVQQPQVAISVAEFHGQPVSVIGQVNTPGVLQLQGRKTLFEILSMAGGVKGDAGKSVKITRRREWGRIPLPTAVDDPSGEFSIAEVNLKAIMEAKNPAENILIQPNDFISVPRAELVYVIGDVKRSGGFLLDNKDEVSVLRALALAEGLGLTAAPKKAKIIRPNGTQRTEIPVNLKDILAGKGTDIAMQADDILFVPSATGKAAIGKTLQSVVQAASSAAIYTSMRGY